MSDPRLVKLARLLTEYSVNLKPGDIVAINGEAIAAPAIREVYRAAIKRGAFVITDIALDGLPEIFYAEANKDQLRWVSPFAKFKIKNIDASIGFWADENTKSLTNVDPQRLAAASAARKPLSKIFMDRSAQKSLRWVGTQWPCQASAQDAEMSLEEYENFVYGAGHLDDPDPIQTWKRISKSQQALTDFLNKAREIRIIAEDTDLRYSCRGRKWVNCDGHYNFPDGEVFTGPVETSVTGHVKYSFPAVHNGREVHGARLTFDAGKVVKAEADKGQDFLRAMIAMDKGACYLGEAAIGTNYNIQRYTKNTLFDEKIGGTIHLALGAGYPETGNKNRSGLHWDMVCDLRQGGAIYADGELIQKNGHFLNNKFPQP
ncbi:MAG: Aminopeptidase 2 [Verrucomicrobiae bacterium]|nr:Aminopeptidase 2 [Verrucomicrobiae bacterium]